MNTMDIDEFINQVSEEPERVVTRTVTTAAPNVLGQAAKPGGLKLTDYISAPGNRVEQRNLRYRHILGPPASQESVDAWQQLHPSHALPADLRRLVSRVNGIHLWADTETRRSYIGLAPIEEWELARIKMYGASADPALLDDRYVAITYHRDGASFVALDVESGTYFLMDAAGPDATTQVASNAGELLDWLWQRRIAPKGMP